MAVDTRDKRMSLVNLALPKGRVLPNPVGGFTMAAQRTHLAYLYALAASSVVAIPGVLRFVGSYIPTLTATAQYQPTLTFLGRFEG